MFKAIKGLSQQQLSLIVSVYVAILLNFPVFYRRFSVDIGLSEAYILTLTKIIVEIISIFFATYFLLNLIAIGGKWFYRLSVSAIIIISTIASYYIAFFNIIIGYGVVVSVMAVNDDLSKESVSYFSTLWTIILSFPVLLLVWLSSMNKHFYSDLTKKSIIKKLGLFISLILIVSLPLSVMGKHQKKLEKLQSRDSASYGGTFAHSYLPLNWLSSMGLYAYVQVTDVIDDNQLFDPSDKFTYIAPKEIDETYVIFIIGETTRWDHMGILGYDRPTTPFLAKENNLLAFKGQSCDTATKLSLRCMFVREFGTEDNPQRTLKEQNVFSVLKTQGFSSELFSMQSELWFYQLTQSDRFALREMIASQKGNEGKYVDDMLLIEPLKESIQSHPKGKHLVILHTKGSHYLYTQRYPRNFAVYKPECMGIDSFCEKEELINSFDNSVLYTDYFISQVIEQVRDKNAIVVYAADHGESIEENNHFHATPKKTAPPEQFRVPILVWASDKFLSSPERRQGFERMKERGASQNYRHEELFDSLLGCLGYSSPDGGIVDKNNWCSPTTEK